MTSRSLLAALLAAVITTQPLVLSAQTSAEEASPPIWRRITFGLVGAALVGGAAAIGAEDQRASVCGSKQCIVGVASIIGGAAGFFMGRELDQKAYRHSVEGPSMNFGLRSVELDDVPTGMVGHEGGVLTLTRNQVGLVDRDLRFRPLLSNVQARTAAVLPRGDYLVLASNTALMGLPMPRGESGARASDVSTLFDEGAMALAPLAGEDVALGSPGRILRLSLGQPGRAQPAGEASSHGLPRGLMMANGTLWSVEDSMLVARDPETLREMGQATLPGPARSLSVSGRTGVACMGADGAALLNLSDPNRPSVMSVVRGMEFAYAGAVLNGRMYVAAGPQGIFVYDVTSPREPDALGVAREVGFAGDLLVHDGRLYILDRGRQQVHRADGLR